MSEIRLLMSVFSRGMSGFSAFMSDISKLMSEFRTFTSEIPNNGNKTHQILTFTVVALP